MNLKQAKEITGGLSAPSKMPGRSFSLPALSTCPAGRELRKKKGTACSKCYALKGNYVRPNVTQALNQRYMLVLTALRDPQFRKQWVDAMALQIKAYSPWWFRWHDSGDVFSSEYLDLILDVVKQTPETKHWIPTRELRLMKARESDIKRVPNLTVRLSSDVIDVLGKGSFQPPGLWGHVQSFTDPDDWDNNTRAVADANGVLCQSKRRGHKCGPCRACWSKDVGHIVYQKH